VTEQEELKQYGQLVAKAWSDPAFKDRLLADPAGTLRAQGFDVPADMEVRVLEPSEARLYVPLPAQVPATEQPDTWVELWRRAHTEPDFKARLLAEPAAVLAEQGVPVPAGVGVEVVEAGDTQGYIMLPPMPQELDIDSPGDDVAGYFSSCWCEQDTTPGITTVRERGPAFTGGTLRPTAVRAPLSFYVSLHR
jgi:hypothetical protein